MKDIKSSVNRVALIATVTLIVSVTHLLIALLSTTVRTNPIGSALLVSNYCEARPEGCSDEVRNVLIEYVEGQRRGARVVTRLQIILNLATSTLMLLFFYNRYFVENNGSTESRKTKNARQRQDERP